MAGNGSGGRDRRGNRSRKIAPVIEMTAVEIPQEPEKAAEAAVHGIEPQAKPADPAPEASAQPEPAEAKPHTSPHDAPPSDARPGDPKPESEAPTAQGPDIIQPPPPAPPEKPRYALPMAAAALIGGLFGLGGGALLTSLMSSPPAVDSARVQRLEQGLAELQRRPAPPTPVSHAAELQALAQQLAGIESEVKRRTEALDQRIAALPAPAAPQPAPPAPTVDLGPLTARLGALERSLQALDQKAEAARAAAGESARAMEPQLRDLTARVTQAAQRAEVTAAAPLFAAAQGLNQAFHRGAPFTGELQALEALGAKPEAVQALRALAARGAPTAQQLAAVFQPLAMAAARAGQPPAAGVQALFENIVRTRAAGAGAADTPEGLVSAIEAALRGGDVGAALAAWQKLPEPARQASEAFGAAARDRQAAAAAIRDIQDMALAALRKAAP